jgi:lipopolysaccharide transport system permease protein
MHYQSTAKVPFWRPAWGLFHEHRGLIHSLVRRDLTSRYKGSLMGLMWTIITPAVMITIYTVIFSGLFGAKFGAEGGHLRFAVYLFCGMLPWIAFSDSIQRSTLVLTDNLNLVRRVVFPLEVLPTNLVFSALVQQLLGTVVLLAVALLMQRTLHLTVLLIPVLLVPQLLMTLGISWLMASLGVFIRDMAHVNQLALQTVMYLTPILYPEDLIPANYRWLIDLNPLAPLIRSYRFIMLDGKAPDWPKLGFTYLFAILCFTLGYWWFERTKRAFADVL